MVDFTTAQIGGPQGGGASVRAPVVDQSTSVLAKGVSSVISIFEKGLVNQAKADEKRLTKEASLRESSVVGSFTKQMNLIADGVQLGKLTPAEAGIRSRSLLTQSITEFPDLSGTLLKTSSTFSSSGVGKVIQEGNEQQQLLRAERKAASEGKYIFPYMSLEEQAEGVLAFRQSEITKRRIEEQTKALQLRRDKVSTSDAERQEEERQGRNLIENELAVFASQKYESYKGQVGQVYADVANGMPLEQATASLKQVLFTFNADLSQMSRGGGKETTESLAAPIRAFLNGAIANVGSENALKRLETSNAIAKAQSVNNELANPEVRKWWGKSTIAGNQNPTVVSGMGNAISGRNAVKNSRTGGSPANLTATDDSENRGVDGYFNMLKNSHNEIKNKGSIIDPVEQNTHVNNVVKGAARDIPTASLVDNKHTIDYLSSPEFGEYMKSGAPMSREEIRKAEGVIVQSIDRELVPAIEDDINSLFGLVTIDQPTLLGVELRGNQVVFTSSSPNRSEQVGVRRLNERYGTAATKTLQAVANLGGGSLDSGFETLKSKLFPVADDAKTEEIQRLGLTKQRLEKRIANPLPGKLSASQKELAEVNAKLRELEGTPEPTFEAASEDTEVAAPEEQLDPFTGERLGASPAIEQARQTGDVSNLPDGSYKDGSGNVIKVVSGKIVGGG